LERLMKGRTTFVIAHRLSTVVNADTIIVLKNGRIAEKGRHDELMAQKGYYASLVKRQTRGLLQNEGE
jgi:ATP-binding cassette, subfamily B, bacterial